MNKSAKKILIYIALAALLILFFYLNRDTINSIERLKDISWFSICNLAILFIISQILYVYKLKIFIRIYNISLTWKEGLSLISAQALGNYLPLSGGVISNAAYLKVKKGLPITHFISYFAGDTILKIFIYSILGILFSFYLYIDQGIFNLPTSLLFLALIVLSLLIFTIKLPSSLNRNKFTQKFLKLQDGLQEIKNHPKAMLLSSVIHILVLIILSARLKIIFNELDTEISLFAIFIMTMITNIIRVASIFPGNLGVRESIISILSKLYGVSASIGLVAAIIDRAVVIIVVFIMGVIFGKNLLNKEVQE